MFNRPAQRPFKLLQRRPLIGLTIHLAHGNSPDPKMRFISFHCIAFHFIQAMTPEMK
jgi:hypothetical protein